MSAKIALSVALLAPLLTVAGAAQAEGCADSFAKSGSPVSGLRFVARVAVPDLTPASAIGQMRGIALARQYDILVAEPEDGSMLMEQPMSGTSRAFPITVTATTSGGTGTVTLDAKLRAAMFVKDAAARDELCGMLNQLKGGRAGLAVAAAARTAVATGTRPLAMTALAFSHQISKDTERNAAAVPLRYKGKAFTISGTVDYIIKDGPYYRVAFKVPNPWEETLRLPNIAPFKTDVSCLMAKGQAAYALTLKPDRSVRLTGTWHAFDEFKHIVWLDDCRPEG